MLNWNNDEGTAEVPNTAEGRAWIEGANRIMDQETEDESGADEWDEHSIELARIGGRWL